MSRRVSIAAVAVGAAVLVWAVGIEPRWLALRRRALRLPRWPAALDGRPWP